MWSRSSFFVGVLTALIAMAGCEATAQPENGGSGQGDLSRSISSQSNESDVGQSGSSSAAAGSVESKNDEGYEISTDGTWEAYDSNRDNYRLHIRKKDGTQDKVIVEDPVLCPCLAGGWVYYFNTLDEIDKVKLDGTGKTKVCGTDAIENLNGSMAVTAEYKDGYILYKTVQLRSAGDDSSYPEVRYKLDLGQEKITPVKD